MDAILRIFAMDWIDALVMAFLVMAVVAAGVGLWRRLTGQSVESTEPQLHHRAA